MSFVDALASCFPCIINKTPTLQINKAQFKILDLLGEGGFSYVYLVQSQNNKGLYALKKIRCPFGNSNFKVAMKEVDSYKEFKSPYIMKSIDSSIVQEPDGSKTIYILLPYFDNGSLQDIINNNSVNGTKMDEDEALRLFIGTCRGLISMHRHQLSTNYTMTSSMDTEDPAYADEEHNPFLSANEITVQHHHHQQPLVSGSDDPNIELGTELTDRISMAHRDIKPANIMISKDGTPVLADLGSCERARVLIKTRAQAITYQELSNEHCTLPYRAPELLDIKVGDEIDEKIDIWSLGCTLYALLYSYSPFEREEQINGANINLAISSGKYSFPNDPEYGEDLKELIKFCLVTDPSERPTIEDVLSKALEVQRFRS